MLNKTVFFTVLALLLTLSPSIIRADEDWA